MRVVGKLMASIEDNYVYISEIDIATYLVYEGFVFSTLIRGKTFYFVFGSEVKSIIDSFPFSDVSKVLASYHSLYKLLKNKISSDIK